MKMRAPVCPKCGMEISERNLNPSNDMAYCDRCDVAHSYRELMGKVAEAVAEFELVPPEKSCFSHVALPDGTERVARKMGREILIMLCFWAGCAAVFFLAATGRLPMRFTIFSVAIAVLILCVTLHRYNVITLDRDRRRLSVCQGFKHKDIGFEEIVQIDATMLSVNDVASYVVRACLKGDETVDVADGLKRDDADYLANLLRMRSFAK